MRAGVTKQGAEYYAHSRRYTNEAYRFVTFEVFTVCKVHKRGSTYSDRVVSVRIIITIRCIVKYALVGSPDYLFLERNRVLRYSQSEGDCKGLARDFKPGVC